MKLSFVRSRFEQDERWSETGDRYILKLFLDFVFRQFNDDGSMTVDWGLAFEALNKLDAGEESAPFAFFLSLFIPICQRWAKHALNRNTVLLSVTSSQARPSKSA